MHVRLTGAACSLKTNLPAVLQCGMHIVRGAPKLHSARSLPLQRLRPRKRAHAAALPDLDLAQLAPDLLAAPYSFAQSITFPDVSPDVLIPPFQFANVAISVLWAPIILAPRWKFTQAVMQSRWTILLPSIAFIYFFLAATIIDSPNLADVFQKSLFLFTDGAADPRNMSKLLSSPAYTAQDWVHLLVWDFGAGRLIYLDAMKKQVPVRLSMLVTFIAGPIGLVVHEVTCAIFPSKQSSGS